MNPIQNLFGSTPTTSTASVGAVSAQTNAPSSVPPPGSGAAATASISPAGQFFSQMQQLSQQDPAQFKAVASQLATSFQSAAGQASGQQAKFLSTLANQFSQAAQTGQLQPPSASPPQGTQGAAQIASSGAAPSVGGHHHHHHGGGGGGGAIQQAFQSAQSILQQALQGTTAASSSGSSTSGTST